MSYLFCVTLLLTVISLRDSYLTQHSPLKGYSRKKKKKKAIAVEVNSQK